MLCFIQFFILYLILNYGWWSLLIGNFKFNLKICLSVWIIVFALTIGAAFTFAQICAFYSSFEAFTVWFCAPGFVAFAAFIMSTILGDLWFECIFIWSEYPDYCLFTTILMFLLCGVLTDILLAFTVWSTRRIVHQTNTVELQAFVLTASASFACSCCSPCLHEFFMRNACFDHFFSNCLNPLSFLLFHQVFFFLSRWFWICEKATLSAWCLHQSRIPKFWCCVAFKIWLVIL